MPDMPKQNSATECPFEIGKAYFIRTVTYHLTGRIRDVVGQFLLLDDAAWIADSGRFMQAIKAGKLSEVEPTDEKVNHYEVTDAALAKFARGENV